MKRKIKKYRLMYRRKDEDGFTSFTRVSVYQNYLQAQGWADRMNSYDGSSFYKEPFYLEVFYE